MSISSISASASTGIQYGQEVSRQRRQDFQNLAKSLESNDLDGAQKAFSDLQSLSQPGSSSTPTATSGTNTVQNDFVALGQALAAGNLSQAQTDFNQMKTDFKGAGQQGATAGVQGHHHHHHARAAYQQQSDSNSTSATATSAIQGAESSALSGANSTSDSLTSTLLSLAA